MFLSRVAVRVDVPAMGYLPVMKVARNRSAASPEIAAGVFWSAMLTNGLVPVPSLYVTKSTPFALVVPVTYRNTYPSAIVSDQISTSMGGAVWGAKPPQEKNEPAPGTGGQ